MRAIIKNIARAVTPVRYRAKARKALGRLLPVDEKFVGLSNKEIFERIYREERWGTNPDGDREYFSGAGSFEHQIVDGYVSRIREFLGEIGETRILIDLGCGDFNVGSRIAPCTTLYIACDIASNIVEEDERRFRADNVEFRVLDLVNDELPIGDVIFVRQVLQHLTNQDIKKFSDRVANHCQYLILTEHLPTNDGFVPNVDKPNGPGTRLVFDSGIDLSAAPFNLRSMSTRILWEHHLAGC